MERLASSLAIASTGLLAGAFAYAFFTVVPTFYEVPLEVHFIYRNALMRHNGAYIQIVMGLSILTPTWWAYSSRGVAGVRFLAMAASLLSLTSFLVTRFGNIPINRLIKTWSAIAPPPDYQEILARWLIFHDIRTAAAVTSFVLIILAQALIRKS